jgi:hypothetical protein
MDSAASEQSQLPGDVAGGTTEVILHFPYVPEQHAEALIHTKPQRWQLRFIRATGGFMAALPALWMAVGLFMGEPVVPLLQNAGSLIALGAFWIWGAPAIIKRLHVRRLRKESIEEGRHNERRVFRHEGITPGLRWDRPVPWSQVEGVEETDAFFLVYVVHSDPVYVPKHSLTPAQDAALRRILREAGFLKGGSRQAALPG